MRKTFLLLLFNVLCLHLDASVVGIKNTKGTCYVNSTLQMLFNMKNFNKILLDKKSKFPSNGYVENYLLAYREHQVASFNHRNIISIHTDKFENENNEPTEIIQNLLVEIKEAGVDLSEVLLTANVRVEEYSLLQHKLEKSLQQNPQYIIVFIDNRSFLPLSFVSSPLEGKDPSLITKSGVIYQLNSFVNACHKTPSTEFSEKVNHSMAYVNYFYKWFLVNDSFFAERSTSQISHLLIGEKTTDDIGLYGSLKKITPGILAYKRLDF